MLILKDDFDYATYSSMLLGVGDVLWLAHDIMTRGIHFNYIVIGLLFLIGNLGLAVGLRKHHKRLRRPLKARKNKIFPILELETTCMPAQWGRQIRSKHNVRKT